MKVAAVQLSSQDDVGANLARVSHWVREAAECGAELVVLPEGFAFLGREPDRRVVAEVLPRGPISSTLSQLCRQHGVHLLAGGMPERAPDQERPYNTSMLLSPVGEILAKYRKIHLFDVDLADGTRLSESSGSSPGSEVVVSQVAEMKVGMSICYDVRFASLFARQREQGAQVLTVPAAFTRSTGRAHWHVLLRARAIETQCYVVAPAQCGRHPFGRETYGHSMIVDPWGEVVVELGEQEGVIVADLSVDRVADVRRQMPVFQHRRL